MRTAFLENDLAPIVGYSSDVSAALTHTQPPIHPLSGTRLDPIHRSRGSPRENRTTRAVKDGSFLVIREKWSKKHGDLLAYSYHYQWHGGPHIRFDMDEEEKPGIPKHYVQFSELTGARSQNVHAPSGAVTIEQVLDMIVREFFWTRTNLASLGVAT
jgi:hypothetical protein